MVAGLETFLSHENKLAIEEFHGLEVQRVVRIGQAEVFRREYSCAACSNLELFRKLRHSLEVSHKYFLWRLRVEGFAVVSFGVEGLGIEDANLLSTENDH